MKIPMVFKAIKFLKLFKSLFCLIILLLFLNTILLKAQDSQKRLNETREKIENEIKTGRVSIGDMALLGTIYIQLEEYEMARQVLMDAYQKDPDNQQVLEALGRLEFVLGNFKEADKWLKRVGDRTTFIEEINERKVTFLINRSIELYQKNDFEQAEISLKEALSYDPYNSLILSMLIQLGKQQGNNDELTGLYRRLLVVDPENAQAYAELGMLLDGQGQSDQAEKAFLNAELFGTEEPYPYFYLVITDLEGQKLEQKYKMPETITRLHLAIGKAVRKISLIKLQAAGAIQQEQGELTSEELIQLENLSKLFIRPRQILEESIILLKECYPNSADYEMDLRRLIDWYPHSLELYSSLGSFLEEQQRFEEAYDHWRGIIEDFTTAGEAHIGMARSLEALGRLHQAEVAYKRARDLTPEIREIYLALNRLHLSDGRGESLLQWYSELYERERTNTILLNAWADLEEAMGLLEDATIHRLRVKKIEEYY